MDGLGVQPCNGGGGGGGGSLCSPPTGRCLEGSSTTADQSVCEPTMLPETLLMCVPLGMLASQCIWERRGYTHAAAQPQTSAELCPGMTQPVAAKVLSER